MSAYAVVIQPEAELDLEEAYEYFEDQKKGLGFDFLEELAEVIELLENTPLIFQKVQGEKRRVIIRRFGYNVIYIVINTEVYILAIMHGSRNPKRWEKRK